MNDEQTNWYEWDAEAKKFSFRKTEDHVFAPYHNGGKRIGDMTRDELLYVIAMGYYEREQLAKALMFVVNGGNAATISGTIDTAQLIVRRLEAEGG